MTPPSAPSSSASDPLDPLPETLESQARVGVRVSGSRAGIRRWLNLLPGSAKVTVTAQDDPAGEEVEITIGLDESQFTTAILKTLIDAKGDLIVGTADDSVGRLAVGSANQMLGVSAGAPAWQAQTYIDHGSIGGLTDDDHTQYTRKDTLAAKGSIYVASAASTPAAQAAGSDYYMPQWLAAATNGLQAGPTTQNWTPTLAQGASSNINKTVNAALYARVGSLVMFLVNLSITASGTAGSPVTFTLPVTAATGANQPIGTGLFLDLSTVTFYNAICQQSSTTAGFLVRSDATGVGGIGAAPNIAVASGDVLVAQGFYLAA